MPSALLSQRIPKPYVVMHPQEAGRLGLAENSPAKILILGAEFFVDVHQDETLPQGLVLVPRSLGIPITGPVAVSFTANELISSEVE